MTLDTWLKSQPGRCTGCGHHVATQGCHCAGSEWDISTAAIKQAAVNGVVHQNDVRPIIRGRIAPKRIGQQYRHALRTGLLVEIRREPSRDHKGKNTHHTAGVYELRSAA